MKKQLRGLNTRFSPDCPSDIPLFLILLIPNLNYLISTTHHNDSARLKAIIKETLRGILVMHRIACIRHQCRKAAVLSCHGCLINTGVEKMNNI
jgi:hypothetical protein